MSIAAGVRMGGRGCPSCGSHDTEGIGKGGAQWCLSCHHRWVPCQSYCRGYRVEVPGPREDRTHGPKVRGCPECGVPDKIARWWPEAWRAVASELAKLKLEPVGL